MMKYSYQVIAVKLGDKDLAAAGVKSDQEFLFQIFANAPVSMKMIGNEPNGPRHVYR